MKVLIIGYGSIGKRHCQVLSNLEIIESIDLVTKQSIKNVACYKSLESVINVAQYDYFIIASETNKHYEQLKYLENTVVNKLIFCEKPLFQSKHDLEVKNNKIFVGYVLRFHPLLEKLKMFLQHEKILVAHAKCGQYLPSWRINTDYKKCYSAKRVEGGGVLLDLSHEIDYVQWLCGRILDIKSYQTKISDLDIDSDDLTMLIGQTDNGVYINISIDYISKQTHRSLLIETIEHTYDIDFVSNKLVKKSKVGLEETYSFSNLERNYMFEKMHLDAISDYKVICSFDEAIKVMETISTIQEQNK